MKKYNANTEQIAIPEIIKIRYFIPKKIINKCADFKRIKDLTIYLKRFQKVDKEILRKFMSNSYDFKIMDSLKEYQNV